MRRIQTMFILGLTFFSASILTLAATLSQLDSNQNGKIDLYDFNSVISLIPQQRNLQDLVLVKNNYNQALVGSKKSKKWHPGHYLRLGKNVSVADFQAQTDNPDNHIFRGFRPIVFWEQIEPERNQFNWSLIDGYLNALSGDQRLLLLFYERDHDASPTCTSASKIPNYMLPMSATVYNNSGAADGCVVKFWESTPRNEMIRVIRVIGERYDSHPKVEALMFDETAFGTPQGVNVAEWGRLRIEGFKALHAGISDAWSHTQVLQSINHAGGQGCDNLRELANFLQPLGHGLANPDSVPWLALPWNCSQDYNYAGLRNGDNPKPVYQIYREFSGKMPIMVGNDTSQLEDPERPRTFNGVLMNYTNLVEHLYKTAITGYVYSTQDPDLQVSGFGGNYLLWNNHWNSITAQRQNPNNPIPPATYTQRYKEAYFDFLNQDNHQTVEGCPDNINCLTQ